MEAAGIDLAVLSDADSIVYFSGYAGYLAMEFGRATILVIPRGTAPILITPLMEAEMARAMVALDDIRPWQDGLDGEWQSALAEIIATSGARRIGYEAGKTHPAIAFCLAEAAREAAADLADITPEIGAMRLVKTPEEIAIMRQAGAVAVAMVEAARETIAVGVPEYEVALAVIAGGTRKAASFLGEDGIDVFCSPVIHGLQVLQSGHHTSMVHRRASTKRIGHGEPTYLCFCGIANFRHFKLGFDREFWIGTVTDEEARAYETVVAAQQAALAEIRPGAIAENVHAAANEVYRSAGHGPAYRTGRAIGYSFLEKPELSSGDRTVLQAGMTFAVDGGLGVAGRYGTRIGDSIVVTETGFDYLTEYPRELTVL